MYRADTSSLGDDSIDPTSLQGGDSIDPTTLQGNDSIVLTSLQDDDSIDPTILQGGDETEEEFKVDPTRSTLQNEKTIADSRQKLRRVKTAFPLLIATVCLLIAVAIWVTQAEVFQGVNNDYKKPYFLAYWSHLSYSVWYIVWKSWRIFPTMRCNRVGDGALKNSRLLIAWSGFFALLVMVTSYTWIQSLSRTNIPANTAIYQSACAIVFIISVPILRERVTVLKVFCVVISIAGVSLLSVFSSNSQCQPPNSTNQTNQTWSHYGGFHKELSDLDNNDPCNVEKSTPLGYVFLGISILMYAFFQVLYKRFATKKDDPAAIMNSVRFLGYMGIHILLWMWVPIVILHFTGYEVFEWPPTWTVFGYMCLQGLLSLLYKICLLLAIALTTPLYSSIGTMLVVPGSVLIDWLVHNFLLTWPAFLGMALILTGFGGFVVSQYVQSKRNAFPENYENTQTKVQVNDDEAEYETLLEQHKEKATNKLYHFIYKYFLV